MTEEIWRPIVGYEGLYEVSSYGRVRSLDRYINKNSFRKGRILKFSTDRRGYLKAYLSLNNKVKTYLVHRLVAISFIPNPDNLPEVNHKDENPSNNNVDNLEWCDRKYNINYGTRMDKVRNTAIKNGYWTGLSEEEYNKKWYQENRDKKKEYNKKWYQENGDKKKEYNKKWYQENGDKKKESWKKWYQENKEKKREYYHQYYLRKKAGL